MIFNKLKWKYPSKGELPICVFEIPVFAHLVDDEGNMKYVVLLWDNILKCCEDPETCEQNCDVTSVRRWEYLDKIIDQLDRI